VAETEAVGEELAAALLPDATLLLEGDLGAGKTALVRGLARGLGIDPGEIQSPTFTLVRERRGATGTRLVHLDIYRLEPHEVESAGIEELLNGPGVKAVEWAERLPFELPEAWVLRIKRDGDERHLEWSRRRKKDS